MDLTAGTIVEGDAGWTLSSNAGGNSKGAFELPDNTDAYISAGRLGADQCAAGIARRPTRSVRFPQVPPGHWFCLRSPKNGDLAVVKVIDLDDGDWGAKLAVEYYERTRD